MTLLEPQSRVVDVDVTSLYPSMMQEVKGQTSSFQYRSDPDLIIGCSDKLVPEYDAGGRGLIFQDRFDPDLNRGYSDKLVTE